MKTPKGILFSSAFSHVAIVYIVVVCENTSKIA